MRLPDRLNEAIENELSGYDHRTLTRAASLLTERYKQDQTGSAALNSNALRLAYLRVRLPATYAVNARAFRELRDRVPAIEIRSMLDLGSGPGTAMWAATSSFPEVEQFTAVERDSELLEAGRRLAFASDHPALRSASWLRQDVNSGLSAVEKHDLVVVSYALNELAPGSAEQLIRRAWALARNIVVIIEPGTPRNFQNVLAARRDLLSLGANVVAPCPHGLECPLASIGDWCHFAQRLERTAEHRRIKGGSMGYEDEKFSYFVAAKSPVQLPDARIVRHPLKHPGHVQLTLCTPNGLQRPTIGKSRKADYKRARQADWGDAWSAVPNEPEHL